MESRSVTIALRRFTLKFSLASILIGVTFVGFASLLGKLFAIHGLIFSVQLLIGFLIVVRIFKFNWVANNLFPRMTVVEAAVLFAICLLLHAIASPAVVSGHRRGRPAPMNRQPLPNTASSTNDSFQPYASLNDRKSSMQGGCSNGIRHDSNTRAHGFSNLHTVRSNLKTSGVGIRIRCNSSSPRHRKHEPTTVVLDVDVLEVSIDDSK